MSKGGRRSKPPSSFVREAVTRKRVEFYETLVREHPLAARAKDAVKRAVKG